MQILTTIGPFDVFYIAMATSIGIFAAAHSPGMPSVMRWMQVVLMITFGVVGDIGAYFHTGIWAELSFWVGLLCVLLVGLIRWKFALDVNEK